MGDSIGTEPETYLKRRRLQRKSQRDHKTIAALHRTQRQYKPMQFADAFDDGESQARAMVFAFHIRAAAKKPVDQALRIDDGRRLVFHGQRAGSGSDTDYARRRRVTARIADQVAQSDQQCLAVGVNMTPVMLHRRVFRERRKDRVVAVGHVLIQVVMAAVALLIVGMSVLIFSVVATWTAGLLAGAGLAVALGLLLGVVPRRMKER